MCIRDSSICLSRYVIAAGESGLLAKDLVQFVDFRGIIVENLHEGSLSSGGSLCSSELKTSSDVLDVLEIHNEILKPLGASSAKCNCLSSLVVTDSMD